MRLYDFTRPQRYTEFEHRLPHARESLAKNPNDGSALAAFGEWWAFRHRPDWAAELFEKSRAAGAEISPLAMARCYWQLDKLPEARVEFRRAMEKKEAPEFYLRLCIDAVERQITAPKTE